MDLPDFIKEEFKIFDRRKVKLSTLYVGLISIDSGVLQYVPVTQTPHYYFVRQELFGEKIGPVSEYRNYQHYADVNAHACSQDNFKRLIHSIRLDKYNYEQWPILVFRYWRRPLPLFRWDVADGFHRLAVLAALGYKYIEVTTLRPKYCVVNRVFRRFKGGAHDREKR
jgi:hypothetical protein